MKIIEEEYRSHSWTKSLKSLSIDTQCIVTDKKHYPSIRTVATRLYKNFGLKYSFKTEGSNIKVWRIK